MLLKAHRSLLYYAARNKKTWIMSKNRQMRCQRPLQPAQGGEIYRQMKQKQPQEETGYAKCCKKMGPLCTRAYSFPQTTSKLSIHPMFTFLWVLWWLSDRNSVMNGDEEQETTGYTDWGDELIHNWQAHAYLPWSCVCLCYWLKNISRAPGNRLEWCFVTDCTQTSAYLTYRGVGGYVIKTLVI